MQDLLKEYQQTANNLETYIQAYKAQLAALEGDSRSLQRRLHLATQELGEVRRSVREIEDYLEAKKKPPGLGGGEEIQRST